MVQVGKDADWLQASAGVHYSLALKKDGTLWAWGDNTKGCLGITSENVAGIPIQVGNDKDWKIVSAGYHKSIAIKNDGTIWAWGEKADWIK